MPRAHRPRSGCDIEYLTADVYINDGNGLGIILSIAVCPKGQVRNVKTRLFDGSDQPQIVAGLERVAYP